MPRSLLVHSAVLALTGLMACDQVDTPTPDEVRDPASVEVAPGPPVMRRLSNVQYTRAVQGLFGDDVFVPSGIEPEIRVDGLRAVGNAVTAISPRGIERYQDAAYDIAAQALEDGRRERWLPCDPATAGCVRDTLEQLGLRAWRRPVSETELDALEGLFTEASTQLGNPIEALEYPLAALLQSPDFLMRAEVGEADDAGGTRLTAWELATRLSFLLWDAPPDEALLAAAEDGSILTADGLDAQAQRLLADPRARQGLRAFITDWLHLDELDGMEKDAGVYVQFNDQLGPSAREETLRVAERLVFDDDTDLRELFTTRKTFVDRTLAALYDIKAPEREGFGEVELPPSGDRRGFFGQAAFLALQSHFNSTSPTLRGKFVREAILCQAVPNPPAGVNTAIPEPTEEAATLRDRVQLHMEVDSCRSCHQLFDPMGLALENYDGVGARRERDNGAEIDASGSLDDKTVDGLSELAQAIFEHPRLPECNLMQLTRFALGRRADDGETELQEVLTEVYAARGHRLQPLLLDLVQSPMFRKVDPSRAPEPVEDSDAEVAP